MPAHLRDARRRNVSSSWLSVCMSEEFDNAICRKPPPGVGADEWSMVWIRPQSRAEVHKAKALCAGCPALVMCRMLVDLSPEPPGGLVQAGIEFGLGARGIADGWAS